MVGVRERLAARTSLPPSLFFSLHPLEDRAVREVETINTFPFLESAGSAACYNTCNTTNLADPPADVGLCYMC